MVQPPDCMPMLSAAEPTTSTVCAASARSGSAAPSFLSSTSVRATASRASARCASEPTDACSASSPNGRSNRPSSNLTRRMLATASSMRSRVRSPRSTPRSVAAMKRRWSYGTMFMSTPAAIERATASS
jgi:hypothetical protein